MTTIPGVRSGVSGLIMLFFGAGIAVALGPGAGSSLEAPRAAPTLFVSPTGSDSGPCNRQSPCASFDRAYRRAGPGAAVEVASGTYDGQRLGVDRSKTSQDDVVFRPAAKARVILTGNLDIYGSHVEFRGMAIPDGNWYVHEGADDVTLRAMDVSKLFITSASNVRVLGGDVGPGENSDPQIKTASRSSVVPTNILLDGVRFHDLVRTDPSAHTECLQIMAANVLTIRRSRFERCATHDVFANPFLTDKLRNVLIENNFFGKTLEGYYSLRIGACENVLVRNNSATQSFYNNDRCPAAFYSNILPSMSRERCGVGGAVWDYNVFRAGRRCGPHDRVASPGFRDPAQLDLHLKRGAAAVDRGNPRSAPRTDIDRQKRPSGRAPDAGADEVPQRRRS